MNTKMLNKSSILRTKKSTVLRMYFIITELIIF